MIKFRSRTYWIIVIIAAFILAYATIGFGFRKIVNIYETCESRHWDGSLVQTPDVNVKCNKAKESDAIYAVGKAWLFDAGDLE